MPSGGLRADGFGQVDAAAVVDGGRPGRPGAGGGAPARRGAGPGDVWSQDSRGARGGARRLPGALRRRGVRPDGDLVRDPGHGPDPPRARRGAAVRRRPGRRVPRARVGDRPDHRPRAQWTGEPGGGARRLLRHDRARCLVRCLGRPGAVGRGASVRRRAPSRRSGRAIGRRFARARAGCRAGGARGHDRRRARLPAGQAGDSRLRGRGGPGERRGRGAAARRTAARGHAARPRAGATTPGVPRHQRRRDVADDSICDGGRRQWPGAQTRTPTGKDRARRRPHLAGVGRAASRPSGPGPGGAVRAAVVRGLRPRREHASADRAGWNGRRAAARRDVWGAAARPGGAAVGDPSAALRGRVCARASARVRSGRPRRRLDRGRSRAGLLARLLGRRAYVDRATATARVGVVRARRRDGGGSRPTDASGNAVPAGGPRRSVRRGGRRGRRCAALSAGWGRRAPRTSGTHAR